MVHGCFSVSAGLVLSVDLDASFHAAWNLGKQTHPPHVVSDPGAPGASGPAKRMSTEEVVGAGMDVCTAAARKWVEGHV